MNSTRSFVASRSRLLYKFSANQMSSRCIPLDSVTLEPLEFNLRSRAINPFVDIISSQEEPDNYDIPLKGVQVIPYFIETNTIGDCEHLATIMMYLNQAPISWGFGYEKLDKGQTRVRVLIDLSCKKEVYCETTSTHRGKLTAKQPGRKNDDLSCRLMQVK